MSKKKGTPSGVEIKVDRSNLNEAKSASGKRTYNNGDEVSKALEGLDVAATYTVAEKLFGRKVRKEWEEKYSHLNAGMQRMNIGNRVRRAINVGEITKKALKEATTPLRKAAKAA